MNRSTADGLKRDLLKHRGWLGVQVTVHHYEYVSTLPTSTVVFAGKPVNSHDGVKTNRAL